MNITVIHRLVKWNKAISLAIMGIVVVGLSESARADDSVPDLKGVWTSQMVGVSLGDAAKGLTVNADTQTKIITHPVEMTIDFQNGRLIAGIKKHSSGNDRFVAAFKAGNTTLIGADAEGDMEFTMLPNGDMESCYTEHGEHRAFAYCAVFHRLQR